MGTGSLEASDEASKAVQKTPHRVSLQSIKDKVRKTETIHPAMAPHMTIVLVQLENGFILLGKSAPADPNNFDPKLGYDFAYEEALRHAWPLEAYLLLEKLNVEKEKGDATQERKIPGDG